MEILSFLRESAGDYPCPGCQASLADCAMELIQQEAAVYTVEVTCASCAISFLVVLRIEQDEDLAAGPPVPPITSDELLDVHQVLNGHQGPLTELFAGP